MNDVVVRFPLSGEWVAVNTPAEKVPSHGTDLWGQAYAYDFLRIDWNDEGFKFFAPAGWRYWLTGVVLEECLGYGAPIYAPFPGEVVEVYDGWPERHRLHPLLDYLRAVRNALLFESRRGQRNGSLLPVLGNYLIIKMADQPLYALCAHLRPARNRVALGECVCEGQEVAQVGHTGNSTAPHLHFQLMDRVALASARGIPCAFRGYEALREGTWTPANGSRPQKRELIRSCPIGHG